MFLVTLPIVTTTGDPGERTIAAIGIVAWRQVEDGTEVRIPLDTGFQAGAEYYGPQYQHLTIALSPQNLVAEIRRQGQASGWDWQIPPCLTVDRASPSGSYGGAVPVDQLAPDEVPSQGGSW
jgi:hypothetical protein